MARGKKFTAEQIIGKLREAEVGLAQGKTVPEVVRKLGVTEQTYSLGSGGTAGCGRIRRSD
jgi:putative transposase